MKRSPDSYKGIYKKGGVTESVDGHETDFRFVRTAEGINIFRRERDGRYVSFMKKGLAQERIDTLKVEERRQLLKESVHKVLGAALVDKLKDRARWYCKGFGMRLYSVFQNTRNYVDKVKPREARKRVESGLASLLEVYKAIPFDELQRHPDHDLLSTINALLPTLKNEIDAILNKKKKDISDLNRIVTEIDNKGLELRARLVTLKKEIQKYHGFEKYEFSAPDINGRMWRGVF